MKSKFKLVVAAALGAMFLCNAPCQGQQKKDIEVTVAALSLPDGSDGLLHLRAGDGPTLPLQLSTRYFSERLDVRGGPIRIYQNPVNAESEQPLPVPLLSMAIPSGKKLVYIVLWPESIEDKTTQWRSMSFSGDDWKENSMKLLNATSEPLGITADKKNLGILPGKSMDFLARDWPQSFPVKIYRLKPEKKVIFSSTWRVSAVRRELCFIGNVNGALSLRALMDLRVPKPPAKE